MKLFDANQTPDEVMEAIRTMPTEVLACLAAPLVRLLLDAGADLAAFAQDRDGLKTAIAARLKEQGERPTPVLVERELGKQRSTSRSPRLSGRIRHSLLLTEGGMLNPSLDYALTVGSTLLPLELDDLQVERPFSEILRRMFFYDRVFNLGRDNRVDQTVTLTLKPRSPHIFSIDKYTDFTTTYSSLYNWTDALTSGDLGKGATVSSKLTMGATVKLRLLTDEEVGGWARVTYTPWRRSPSLLTAERSSELQELKETGSRSSLKSSRDCFGRPEAR